jgi:cytochrome c-type biogenesis protein CcmH
VTRRLGPGIALAAVVIGALVWAAWPDAGPSTPRERARGLAEELRCPDCEGLSVADSSTPTARAIRTDVGRRVARGESDEQIRQAYVDRYGESILLRPEGGGLGFLVWGLPIAALLIGAGGLALALWRWRRQPRLSSTDADEVLVARTRETAR